MVLWNNKLIFTIAIKLLSKTIRVNLYVIHDIR